MLLELNDFIDNLRCPKTGNKLILSSNKLISNSTNTLDYDIIDGKPVLVDFEKSILDKEYVLKNNAISPIMRNTYGGLVKVFKNLFEPPRLQSINCIKRFISELKKMKVNPRVLIIGGGSIGFLMDSFYNDTDIDLISMDIYLSPNVQLLGDAHSIPIENSFFDCVIIQTVLEHVLEPHVVVKEISRVLKNDGVVYSETPFLQHVHEGAYDFTRFTDSGHKFLFRDFEHLESGIIGGIGTHLLWTIEIFTRSIFRSKIAGKLFKIAFFWVKYFDYLIPNSYHIDAASCFFFLGRKNNSYFNYKDVIKYYKGAQN